MKQILLILIGLSVLSNADFSKSGDIVTDNTTGLQWQDDAVGSMMTWQDTINYCENLALESHSDWRLPNINELKTIIDRAKYNPSIVDGFEYTTTGSFWSSTTYEGSHDKAWNVHFYGGDTYDEPKSYENFVRCVRAGQ